MKPNPMLALFNLGGTEIILIVTLGLILFGAKKLPELAKGLGAGIKEFKKALNDALEEMPQPHVRRNSISNAQAAKIL